MDVVKNCFRFHRGNQGSVFRSVRRSGGCWLSWSWFQKAAETGGIAQLHGSQRERVQEAVKKAKIVQPARFELATFRV